MRLDEIKQAQTKPKDLSRRGSRKDALELGEMAGSLRSLELEISNERERLKMNPQTQNLSQRLSISAGIELAKMEIKAAEERLENLRADGASHAPSQFEEMLSKAIAQAVKRRNACEWQGIALELLERLERKGIPLESLELRDGWGEEEELPFHWQGRGEFALYFYAKTAEEGARARETIRETLEAMSAENLLAIDGAGSGGFFEPFFWIKANPQARARK